MKYNIAVDFAGSIYYTIEADSHDEAYEKAKAIHTPRETIETYWIYEENYYVEDQNGLQCEYFSCAVD